MRLMHSHLRFRKWVGLLLVAAACNSAPRPATRGHESEADALEDIDDTMAATDSDDFEAVLDTDSPSSEDAASSLDGIVLDCPADWTCGYRHDGVDCGVCEFHDATGRVLSFCDETIHQCIALLPSCADGWCMVPSGSYQAGYPRRADIAALEMPPHRVILSRSFRIQETEVTQAEWTNLMGYNPSPYAECGGDCPVSGMTFFDVLTYANRKSLADGRAPCYDLTGCRFSTPDRDLVCDRATFLGPDCDGYRLPSEAEWELSANAGTTTCYSAGQLDAIGAGPCEEVEISSRVSWYCANSAVSYGGCVDLSVGHPGAATCAGVHPVALKEANGLGLFDVNGNVAEFTGTLWHAPFSTELLVDPGYDTVIASGQPVTARGGYFGAGPGAACSAFRAGALSGYHPNNAALGFYGFRLVQTAFASVRSPEFR